MKKLTLLATALLFAGASFAHDGKACCHKKDCTKETKACCNKKHCTNKSASTKTATTDNKKS